MKCEVCDGEGFTVEHDLKCDGGCGSYPVRVRCETCRGTGEIITYTEEELQEAVQEERESIIQECEWIKEQYEFSSIILLPDRSWWKDIEEIRNRK